MGKRRQRWPWRAREAVAASVQLLRTHTLVAQDQQQQQQEEEEAGAAPGAGHMRASVCVSCLPSDADVRMSEAQGKVRVPRVKGSHVHCKCLTVNQGRSLSLSSYVQKRRNFPFCCCCRRFLVLTYLLLIFSCSEGVSLSLTLQVPGSS